MFIRKKTLFEGKVAIQICQGIRHQGKVQQRVLRHVGTCDVDDQENLDKLLQAGFFLKDELEKERAKKEEERAPNLPLFTPLEPPKPQEKPPAPVEADGREHHWIDTAKLKETARIVEGIHAIFGSTLDRFNLQPILGKRHYETLGI